MSSAAESFVIALGRASKRGHRYLRGLSSADRDDVISTALLACWENRAAYKPDQSLDDWFMDALRVARNRFKRREHISADEFIEQMAVPDDTSIRAEVLEIVEKLQANPTKQNMRKLRQLIPEPLEFQRVLRKSAEARDPYDQPMTRIDRELSQLDMPPKSNKDCPPCWRCMYFQGFMPTRYTPRRNVPNDEEVQRAVWATEEAKIAIAGAIQSGNWR